MDMEIFITLYEELENMSDEERIFVFANLNHIITKFNEKFNKTITIRFPKK